MSIRRTAGFLWLVFFLVVPLPYFAVVMGREPGLQLLVFAGATGAAAIAEPSAIAGMIAGFFWVQLLLYAWLLRVFARRLAKLPRSASGRTRLALGLTAGLLFVSFFRIYATPFSPTGLQANLAELYVGPSVTVPAPAPESKD